MSTIYSFVAEGDSLSFGSGSYYTLAWDIATEVARFGDGLTIRKGLRYHHSETEIVANFALAGSRLYDPGGNEDGGHLMFPARVVALDGLIATGYAPTSGRSPRKHVLCLLVGTNPSGSDGADFADHVGDYCLARVAAGWSGVILGTLPSRTDGIIANFDTNFKTPYNAAIKAGGWAAAHGVLAIADFAADPEIGANGAADNETWFSDQVHPTPEGFALMAARFNTAKAAAITALGG